MAGFTGDFPNFTTSALAGRHDGVTFTTLRSFGEHPSDLDSLAKPRGLHALTKLYDGSIIVTGGSNLQAPFTDAYLSVD